MNKINLTMMAASLSLILAAPAFAGHWDKHEYYYNSREYKINQHLDRQRYRIERGIERDRLTHKEAKILKKKQRKIRRLAREYQEDGHLSRREYRKLNNKLNKNSKLIREFAHNDVNKYVIFHDKYAHKSFNNIY